MKRLLCGNLRHFFVLDALNWFEKFFHQWQAYILTRKNKDFFVVIQRIVSIVDLWTIFLNRSYMLTRITRIIRSKDIYCSGLTEPILKILLPFLHFWISIGYILIDTEKYPKYYQTKYSCSNKILNQFWKFFC